MINADDKNKLLQQIDRFVNQQNSNKEPKLYEIRFYVDTETAKDRAAFFGFINGERHINCQKIVDLTFGSGNLTSHIILDNSIDYDKLTLNDKNIDDANFAEDLEVLTEDITDNDILNPTKFEETNKYDLIIFNPQFGGSSYPNGDLGIKKLYEEEFIFHMYGVALEDALRNKFDCSDCTISIDAVTRKILIHSDSLNKVQMKERFGRTKVFNYHDFFYRSRETKAEGEESNLILFRRTLEKIVYEGTTVVFLGDEKDYNLFFRDFNDYVVYNPDNGKQLIVGKKGTSDNKVCYRKEAGSFLETDCHGQTHVYEDIDLENLLGDIHTNLLDLKSLDGGELFILEEKTGVGTETPKPEPITMNKQKPFKNFLLKLFIKEIE